MTKEERDQSNFISKNKGIAIITIIFIISSDPLIGIYPDPKRGQIFSSTILFA